MFPYMIKIESKKNQSIHRLVATYFLDNPRMCREVNHKNGRKDDNRVENLEWCTSSENKKHAYRTGIINHRGEKSNNHKVLDKDVRKMRKMYKNGKLCKDIAKIYPLAISSIWQIVNYKRWTHI